MDLQTKNTLEALMRGLFLHCPRCGKGVTFQGLFNMLPTCSVCGLQYEKQSGESIGGMYINLGLVEVLSVTGYFLTQILFSPPFILQITFWVTFNLVFVVLFYRHARSLWAAISYLAQDR